MLSSLGCVWICRLQDAFWQIPVCLFVCFFAFKGLVLTVQLWSWWTEKRGEFSCHRQNLCYKMTNTAHGEEKEGGGRQDSHAGANQNTKSQTIRRRGEAWTENYHHHHHHQLRPHIRFQDKTRQSDLGRNKCVIYRCHSNYCEAMLKRWVSPSVNERAIAPLRVGTRWPIWKKKSVNANPRRTLK